jgi:hypothetical protein
MINRENWLRFVTATAMPFGMNGYFARPFADQWQSCFGSPSVFRRSLIGIFIRLTGFYRRGFWVGLFPKPLGDLEHIDLEFLPPGHFIAGLMQLPMMSTAKGYGELIAHFEAKRSGLGKPQVVRIARLPATDKTGLRGHESQMALVAKPFGFGDGEKALIDLRWDEAG